MRSTTPASSNPRRRKASIAVLLALCALAAGVQALAPASAGAVANQQTDCEPTAVPGIGINPKTGVTCILAGSGIEVVEIEGSPVLCPTRSNCLARGPLHAGPGGGGGVDESSSVIPGRPPRRIYPWELELPEEGRKAREKRRGEMDPQDRKFKQALCSVIETWWQRIYLHWPKNFHDLHTYLNDKEAAIRGHYRFDGNAEYERELPEFLSFERKVATLSGLKQKAECWVFEP